MSSTPRLHAILVSLPLVLFALSAAPAASAASGGAKAIARHSRDPVPGETGNDTDGDTADGVVSLGSELVHGVMSNPDYRITATTTATRTNTPLIDIPQTLQAIPIRLLRDQGAHSLADAMRNAPGVSVQAGEGNRDEVVIRGVKTKADFFVNGVRDDTEYFRDLYNVQEIDVLQGPAAVLFGRGGSGGVINIVTKHAVRRPIHNLTLEAGSWRHRRATVDFGGAMGQRSAFRINAMGEDSGGFRDHFFLHRYGVNPSFSFQFGDATELYVSLEHLYDRRRADRGIPSRDGRPVDVDPATFFGSPEQNVARATVDSLYARVEHDAGGGMTFRDTFRATRTDKFYQNVYPGSAVSADDTLTLSAYNHAHKRTGYFNQAELVYNLAGGGVRHRFLLGFELGWQGDDDHENKSADIDHVPLGHPIANGVFDRVDRDNRVVGHSLGVYAQDQLTFSEHWKALAGIRWDRFSVDAQYHLLPPGSGTHHTDTSWSPRVGLIYQPTASDSLYASVTRTFTPQGSNLALSLKRPKGADLAPEKAVNYEIGNKLNLLGGRLSLTAALFQLDLDHVNSPDPNDPTRLVQTGAQRTRGFQLGLTGNLTARWSIYAGYARLDAEIRHATEDAPAGARVALVPDHQFSLWTRYALDDHWGLGGGWVGRSRVYASFSNAVVLPGYVRTDLMAYYHNDALRVSLNLDNVFDIRYYATASGDNQIMPGAPRSVGISCSISF